jgi:hypothetical protein
MQQTKLFRGPIGREKHRRPGNALRDGRMDARHDEVVRRAVHEGAASVKIHHGARRLESMAEEHETEGALGGDFKAKEGEIVKACDTFENVRDRGAQKLKKPPRTGKEDVGVG